MAAVNELEYSTTAASNTEIASLGILGSDLVENFDNALRAVMAYRASALTRPVTKSSGATAVKADHNQFWRCTASITIGLTAAATLTSGWSLFVSAAGEVAVVIDPNSSETINGSATLTLRAGQSCWVICDGTNFHTVMNDLQTAPLGHLHGLTLSNGSDATNDIDIAAGEAASAGGYLMVNGSTLTKRLDASWAVGSGNGGLDTGSIANTTYHIWLIQRSDTGVVDALFSESATAPTMPTNYDRKRRIGSIIRASAAIVAFGQAGNHFIRNDPAEVRSSTSAAATALLAVLVPAGIVVQPLLTSKQIQGSAGSAITSVNSAGKTVAAISQTSLASQYDVGTVDGGVFTDTSARIQFEVVIGGGTLSQNILQSRGWIDTRGMLA